MQHSQVLEGSESCHDVYIESTNKLEKNGKLTDKRRKERATKATSKDTNVTM
jgi:hypothetical protein